MKKRNARAREIVTIKREAIRAYSNGKGHVRAVQVGGGRESKERRNRTGHVEATRRLRGLASRVKVKPRADAWSIVEIRPVVLPSGGRASTRLVADARSKTTRDPRYVKSHIPGSPRLSAKVTSSARNRRRTGSLSKRTTRARHLKSFRLDFLLRRQSLAAFRDASRVRPTAHAHRHPPSLIVVDG